MKFLEKIFSIKNDKRCYKIITILGLKIKIKNKLKQEIKELKLKLNCLENSYLTLNSKFQKLSYAISRTTWDFLSEPRKKISEDEHQQNVDSLLANLSDEAKKNALCLLEKFDKAYYGDYVLINDIYTKDEIEELHNIRKFYKAPIKKDDYYQWKNYKLPINFFESSVFLSKHGLGVIKNKNYIEDRAIIDVGGFIGDSVLIFRNEFINNPIYSFEPCSENFKLMQKTLEINNLLNVYIENFALGDNNKESKILYTQEGSRIYDNPEVGNESILERTFDSYVAEKNLKVGLIKVDVEGYEQNFLRGAYNTICEQKPILLISLYHKYDDFFKIKPLIESWNLGYKFDFFQGMKQEIDILSETLLICEPY